jgi:hypothetical protein
LDLLFINVAPFCAKLFRRTLYSSDWALENFGQKFGTTKLSPNQAFKGRCLADGSPADLKAVRGMVDWLQNP